MHSACLYTFSYLLEGSPQKKGAPEELCGVEEIHIDECKGNSELLARNGTVLRVCLHT